MTETERLEALVAKLDEYIELIIEESAGLVVLASVHGWKSKSYERGGSLRSEIDKLR